ITTGRQAGRSGGGPGGSPAAASPGWVAPAEEVSCSGASPAASGAGGTADRGSSTAGSALAAPAPSVATRSMVGGRRGGPPGGGADPAGGGGVSDMSGPWTIRRSDQEFSADRRLPRNKFPRPRTSVVWAAAAAADHPSSAISAPSSGREAIRIAVAP